MPTNGNGSGVAKGKPDEALETALERVFTELAELHRACARSPRAHTPEPLAVHLLDRTLAKARRELARKGAVGGRLYLLTEDGRACAVETDHLIRGAPASSAERTANRAAGVDALWRYLRALNLRPSVAIVVTEAWASPFDGYELRRPGEEPRD